MFWIKKTLPSLGIVLGLLAVSACSSGGGYYYHPHYVSAERLLSVTTERVSFPLSDVEDVLPIEDWMNQDRPSAVEIVCSDASDICEQAKYMMQAQGIRYRVEEGNGPSKAVLIYDRVLANACQQSDFGCSVSANTVQMTSDYDQFLQPPLADYPAAVKAVRKIQESYLR